MSLRQKAKIFSQSRQQRKEDDSFEETLCERAVFARLCVFA
jgi:hypothetical protein